jgi:hypothetical protein
MLDLSPLFVFACVLALCTAAVVCFGIVFGFKFKRGKEEWHINSEKIPTGLVPKEIDTAIKELKADISLFQDDLDKFRDDLDDLKMKE